MTESIKVPDLLDYPTFFDTNEYKKMFVGTFSYIIEPYDLENGINLYLGFRDEFIVTRAADFKSEEFDLRNQDGDLLDVLIWSEKLKDMMKSIRITDASFYFSKDKNGKLVLVDVMVSANKFLGPGMIRDLFDKIVPTQGIIGTEVLDEDIMSSNSGNFVKPSRFKYTFENKIIRPQYGFIK